MLVAAFGAYRLAGRWDTMAAGFGQAVEDMVGNLPFANEGDRFPTRAVLMHGSDSFAILERAVVDTDRGRLRYSFFGEPIGRENGEVLQGLAEEHLFVRAADSLELHFELVPTPMPDRDLLVRIVVPVEDDTLVFVNRS